MQLFLKSEPTAARRRIYFTAVDPTNLQTRLTGFAAGIAVYISQDGATSNAGGGTVVEVDAAHMQGLYYYEATASELSVLGPVLFRISKTGMEPRELGGQVVYFNPYDNMGLGLGSLPSANPANPGGLPTVGTGAGQIHVDGAGRVYSLVDAFTPLVITAASIATDALTAITNAVFSATIEPASGGGSLTFIQAVRGFVGGILGTVSGFNTGLHDYKSQDGTKDRIKATVTSSGRTITSTDFT